MVSILIPMFILFIGLFIYAFTGGKLSEVGKILFFCGALVVTSMLAHQVIRLP